MRLSGLHAAFAASTVEELDALSSHTKGGTDR